MSIAENTDRALRPLEGRAIATALGPRPVMVVGTARDGRANFAPAAFCAPLSYDPPLVTLGLKPTSFTCEILEQTGACTLSTVDADAAKAVLWCGSRSGRTTDKSEGLPCAWADGERPLPYPRNALSVMEARVQSIIEAGDHRLFVLEIAEAATRLPNTKEGRLATEPTLLCLEHSAFACAKQIF
ncbi:flavin reductase family protein [Adlercreutzia shanghongiae]|uniref:Flavin reductase family protein n=1 Tax=Adlercreutzia shanghongiae TaxID=3111773 RepID=A0ABU6IX88_9ACTN|nr:flavin reductase family protein [Adlercreutzia sp. R22]MEC4294453.1 flavin reductase family protein [Adlercreutzia sp. R22]